MKHEADYNDPADRPPYQELGSQTMLDLDALRTEIQTDPDKLGYAGALATGSDNQVADLLNMRRYPGYGPVAITPVLIWLAKWGIMPRLRAATQSDKPDIAGIAEVAMMLVSNPNIPALDVGLPEVQQMLSALVIADVIPLAASEELLTQGMVQRSRAEILGMNTVTADQVAQAREG